MTNGVTATPCGTCAACVDIDAGRFVDLLELDAASNTGIDNMREILDNARYAPTVGRYKVYLIDEVHMLSKAAFNSMLKTLEEPPEHVKFVLATTDPQKIPGDGAVALPAVQPEAAAAGADRRAARRHPRRRRRSRSTPAALALIAQRRPGLDARCAVAARPGDRLWRRRGPRGRRARRCWAPSIAITSIGSPMRSTAGDGPALLAEADAMAARGVAFASGARGARVAVSSDRASRRPCRRRSPAMDDGERVSALAASMPPEAVQLAYQICVQGRADLALAPDEATGFSMTLLRLLAFEPGARQRRRTAIRRSRAAARAAERDSTRNRARAAGARPPRRQRRARSAAPAPPTRAATVDAARRRRASGRRSSRRSSCRRSRRNSPRRPSSSRSRATCSRSRCPRRTSISPTGRTRTSSRLALDQATGRKWLLAFEVGAAPRASLAAQEKRARAEQQAKTEAAFRDEPFVRDVLERFDAKIRPDSIKPVVLDADAASPHQDACHDEEPARRADEAGAADAGQPQEGAGRARADRRSRARRAPAWSRS